MNMAKYTSGWQSAAEATGESQYLNQLQEDLKLIFLTETDLFYIQGGFFTWPPPSRLAPPPKMLRLAPP